MWCPHGLIVAVGLAGPAAQIIGQPAVEPVSTPDGIRALISQLGSSRYQERDQAARRLAQLDESAPFLREAIQSRDEEVARLAKKALAEIRARIRPREICRFQALGKAGHVDRMLAGLVEWDGASDDVGLWQGTLDAVWSLADRAMAADVERDQSKALKESPPRALKQTPKELLVEPGDAAQAAFGLRLVRTPTPLRLRDFGGAALALESVSVDRRLDRAIVLAEGPVKCKGTIRNSIIICCSDVEAGIEILNSVIVARGSIKCPLHVKDSILVASGKVDTSRGLVPGQRETNCIREEDATPLGLVKWFTPADVGLEVTPAKDSVRVEKLHDGKLPARAGLKVGDLITAVDRGKVDSAETFRKLLRRGSVQDRCVLTVKRGDETLDVTLDFRAAERDAEKKKDK